MREHGEGYYSENYGQEEDPLGLMERRGREDQEEGDDG